MKARELDNLLSAVSTEAKVYIRTSNRETHEICAVELYRNNGVDAICLGYKLVDDMQREEGSLVSENDEIAAAITLLQSKGIKVEE